MDFQKFIRRLTEEDFHILERKSISYGKQVRLGCGAIINLYDKGTVLVQGKFIKSAREESLSLLKVILPPHTKWSIE